VLPSSPSASVPDASIINHIDRNNDAPPNLDSREAIRDLVVAFYRDVAVDDLLGPVFADVAHVDWAAHLPKVTDYWCRVLLGEPGYDGTILGPHQAVHDLEPFTPAMFDRWFSLFVDAVDDHWCGPSAHRARAHARRIAGMLARRLTGTDWAPDAPGDKPGIASLDHPSAGDRNEHG